MAQEQEEQVTIDNLAGGGAAELFAAAMEQVAENVQDPNTEATASREITLKLIIKPLGDRSQAITRVRVQTKLAPARDVSTTMYFGKRNGKSIAVGVDMRQGRLFDNEEPTITPISRAQESK